MIIKHRNEIIQLNTNLLDYQGITDPSELVELHTERIELEYRMSKTKDPVELNFLFAFWRQNQFNLQSAWGFDQNAKYHKEWTVPGCKCPKMDNEDWYPSGMMVIRADCPIHGK